MSGSSWFFSINGTVTNNGPAGATGVLVTVNVAGGLTTIGNNAGCGTGGTLICVVGNVANGASKSFRVDFRADGPGSYTNNGIASLNQSDPQPGNNTQNVTTVITTLKASTGQPVQARTTLLGADGGGAGLRGRLLVNEATSRNVEGGETSLTLELRPGRNHFVAHADSPREGSWRFDFGGTRGLVGGSVLVDAGDVLSSDGQTVSFRVPPGPTEIRFSIDVRDPSP